MPTRLFLITGFALDARAFSLLHLPSDRTRLLDLPDLRPGDTLATYAARLIDATDYQPTDAIGGVSLGGMLALEIARQRGARSISLIASCTHPRFLRAPFRGLARLAPEAPDPVLRHIFSQLPVFLHRVGMMSATNRDMLQGVMESFPIPLLRFIPPLIMAWPGCEPTAPLYRLHARGDWMIRYDGIGHCDGLLPGRNHLLPVSHPEICRNFLLPRYAD